ncbi:TrkA C-terminal domain-containing protein [Candidatus Woesearchaeota archaeon]|nr:TrkA C-terminal domain-containing protein [Candidatus Woesearchaeota archaeon]
MRKVLGALLAVLALGIAGYTFIEKQQFADALLSTAAVMTTTGIPGNLSQPGKLFTAALLLASVGIVVAAVARFFNPPIEDSEETLTGFFGASGQENLIMKEVSVNKKSSLSGLSKAQILQNYGAVVVGIKHRAGFDINVPLNTKVKSGSTVLLLGSPATLLGVGKKRKR